MVPHQVINFHHPLRQLHWHNKVSSHRAELDNLFETGKLHSAARLLFFWEETVSHVSHYVPFLGVFFNLPHLVIPEI